MRAIAILGFVALAITFGLGWGLSAATDGNPHVVPPMFAAGMLAVGVLLIGVGFHRRN